MRRVIGTAALLVLAACARPHHPNPYVPPETQYSTGSTLLAAGGLVSASVGAQVAQNPRASASTRTAGNAAMGAGVAMMAASIVDAVEVQKEREQFYKLYNAFYHRYFSPPPLSEPDPRPALPPVPEVPFNFQEDPPAEEDP